MSARAGVARLSDLTCPRCGNMSLSATDALSGWCGVCKDHTKPPATPINPPPAPTQHN